MIAKILFVTDLHKRYKDSTSIKGQLEVQNLIQNDIISFTKEYGITHIVLCGDWYDRGFHGLGQAFGAMEMDRRLSESVGGNVYLCVGNHFFLERDENPEMYIIQPNAFIKPQNDIPVPEEPIFKMVQDLTFGNVKISFFHFNKLNKNYVAAREPNITFHVGVYHDDCVIPGWIRERDGYTGDVSMSHMNMVYNNIDFAVHGHIHTKVGMTNVELNSGRKVPLCIPGSLGITQNIESAKHTTVSLPILEIDDDYSVQMRQKEFSTHMELLKFYAPKKSKKENKALDFEKKNFTTTKISNQSLPTFLSSRGYQQHQLKLIDAASHDKLTLSTAVGIITEVM